MRRSGFLRLILGLAAAFAPWMAQAPGAQTGQGEAKVEVRVVPAIAVSAPVAYKFLGNVGSGSSGRICAVIPFIVHANTPSVRLQVSATHLYKGGVADAPHIPLVLTEPPDVISDCTQVGSVDNVLPWSTEPYTSHGLPGLCTEPREFTSGKETFQSDVDVKLHSAGHATSHTAGPNQPNPADDPSPHSAGS